VDSAKIKANNSAYFATTIALPVKTIKMLDFQRIHEPYKDSLNLAIRDVANSGHYIGGPVVQAFEKELSEFLNSNVCGVGNGTDALQIALMALGVGPGDEVVVPAFTYAASAEVIGLLGATAVWCDVQEATFNLHPESLEQVLTEKTKAIIAVHLYGACADIESIELKAPGIPIIEDTAQAFGAKWLSGKYKGRYAGTVGTFGTLSFFPTKSLGGMGDGGAIISSDYSLHERASQIAKHGQKEKYVHEVIGVNSRLDPIQAAVLSVKLKYFHDSLKTRKKLAHTYANGLQHIGEIIAPSNVDDGHIVHQYTVRVLNGKRDALKKYLAAHGVDSMVYYPIGLHAQKAYSHWPQKCSLNVTNSLVNEVLSLPIGEHLTKEEVSYIIATIESFYNHD
jgi:UDP-2-acetamido-2-deoxy-ribo-hexuluronate aminotransferase